MLCENKHKDHDTLDFSNILIDKEDLIKTNNNLKDVIDKYKNKIKIIKS
jgi:hypothetical protein